MKPHKVHNSSIKKTHGSHIVVVQRCQLLIMSHFSRHGQPWTLTIWHVAHIIYCYPIKRMCLITQFYGIKKTHEYRKNKDSKCGDANQAHNN